MKQLKYIGKFEDLGNYIDLNKWIYSYNYYELFINTINYKTKKTEKHNFSLMLQIWADGEILLYIDNDYDFGEVTYKDDLVCIDEIRDKLLIDDYIDLFSILEPLMNLFKNNLIEILEK